MSTGVSDTYQAYERLVAALQAHLGAVEKRSGEHDPAVQAAFSDLRAAAAEYDDVLYREHDEVTPFDLPPLDGDDGDDEDPDEDPARLSLLARWDFSVIDPDLLRQRATAALGEDVESNAVAVAAIAHVRGHSGLGDVRRAASVGLHWHGSTTWVVAADADPQSEDTDWMDDAFANADSDALLCRFDVPVRRDGAPEEPEA
jgi:hypothetical protein